MRVILTSPLLTEDMTYQCTKAVSALQFGLSPKSAYQLIVLTRCNYANFLLPPAPFLHYAILFLKRFPTGDTCCDRTWEDNTSLQFCLGCRSNIYKQLLKLSSERFRCPQKFGYAEALDSSSKVTARSFKKPSSSPTDVDAREFNLMRMLPHYIIMWWLLQQ